MSAVNRKDLAHVTDTAADIEAMLSNDTPLSTSKVAMIFGVHPKTVSRWETEGLLKAIRTPGGHRRYKPAELRRFMVARQGTDEVKEEKGRDA